MGNFSIHTRVTGMLFTRPAEILPLFVKEIKGGMAESVALVQYETVNRTPVSDGFLRRSIGSDIRGNGMELEGIIGSPLVYALPVEQGAAPHFPPLGPIELWLSRKGNLYNNMFGAADSLKHSAFLVARKISIVGLKANWMFRDALEASVTRIENIWEAAVERACSAIQ